MLKRLLITLLSSLLILTSCRKNDNGDKETYLLSFEQLRSTTASEARSLLTPLTAINPQIISVIENLNFDIKVYKVVYKTTFKGAVINASGIISVPETSEQVPVLSFHKGTNTLHSQAPTVDLTDPVYNFIENMAGIGFIVLIPDYIGYGESSGYLHPYHHRASNDAAIIDLIKATEEFLLSGQVQAKEDNRVFLMGYSQGGWATMSVLNTIETSGVLSKQIVAASCGAGAYNLYDFAKYIIDTEEYHTPLYMPFYIESYLNNGFMEGPNNIYFKEPYASRIPLLFNGQTTGSEINSQLTRDMTLLFTDNLRTNLETSPDFQSFRNSLTENSIDAWQIGASLLLVHGTIDTDVPVFETENIYNSFIQAGVSSDKIRKILLEGKAHDSAIIPFGVETFVYFNAIK